MKIYLKVILSIFLVVIIGLGTYLGVITKGFKNWSKFKEVKNNVIDVSNLNKQLQDKEKEKQKAIEDYNKAVDDYEQERQNVYLEVKSAHINLLNSHDSLEVSKLALKEAKEQQYQAFRRYQVGLGNAIEFKDAENTYLNAQLNYYSNLLDYNVNAAELERVIGAPIQISNNNL